MLEVLVALTVLALTLTVYYPAFRGAVQGVGRLDGHAAAHQIAISLVEEHTSARMPKLGSFQGREGPHRWRVSVGQAADGLAPEMAAGWALYEVVVFVEWPPQHRFQLTTYRLGKQK